LHTTRIFQNGRGGGKRELEAGTTKRDDEIKQAESRGYFRGLRAVGNLCEFPSLIPANAFPVQGYPTIPPIVKHLIANIVPPIASPPAPLSLPQDYNAISPYLTDLDHRTNVFVLGKYAGKDVHVKLNLAIDLETDENDPETPSQI
jgi:hypothetical protein